MVSYDTTKVGLSRLKDFEYLSSYIGCYVPSALPEPPLGMLRVSVEGAEASKTEYAALYQKIGGEDGSTPDKFILPYVPKVGDVEYYLVGKVMFSDTVVSGNIISYAFTSTNLDENGYIVFQHGINHLNPIIQIKDSSGTFVWPVEIINMSGISKIKIGRTFSGTWTALAVG